VLTVTFQKPGTYVMYCPIIGHRLAGMKGSVVVSSGRRSGGASGLLLDVKERYEGSHHRRYWRHWKDLDA